MVYDPFLIWDVGFQLSFLAVFGLVYYQPKIYNWLYFKNKWADKLWAAVAMSLAAQLATLPLSIYYFHQFPVYFIISNLFILIPITILMYLGIAILLVRVYFLAPIFEWIITFTNQGLKWISNLPYAGITEIWLNKWQLFLFSRL
ncbi:ComEC/Rec2 family competence protein [Pedobacter sp. SL55]|uniref:ComEC/Rec2 family competence protein n=1 Tax=Pedobacter sp. SL55 TaxID=2995161 RepID=UPI00226D87FE|nr:ComEC/Rec2 family competence protein [Pedobacter sp. SL55]WAC42741.1 ComEC/Rec2 family competence protein [Pedobacter sp. SL55]